MAPPNIIDQSSDDEDVVLYSPAPSITTPKNIQKLFNLQQNSPVSSPVSSTKKRRLHIGSPSTPTAKRVQLAPALGSPAKPVEILDDDESPEAELQHIIDLTERHQDGGLPTFTISADDVGTSEWSLDDYMTDAQFQKYLRRQSIEEEKQAKTRFEQREVIHSYVRKNPSFRCATGKTVELKDGTFLHIVNIFKDGHDRVSLAGHHLVRQNSLGLMMPRRRNEVVLVRRVPEFTRDHSTVFHEVSIDDVLKNRAAVFTNQSFPRMSAREDSANFSEPSQDVDLGPLFCRWIFTTIINERKKSVEEFIAHLKPHEADNKVRETKENGMRSTRVTKTRLRDGWRNCETVLGGSERTSRTLVAEDGSSFVNVSSSYTFGDAFCGAGGTSRGAVDAQLELRWGFDINPEAIESYRRNFEARGADCRNESVNEFINYLDRLADVTTVRVDVLHISPPCQPFSPAHTIASQERDENNQAALPSVWNLIHKLKPRIVTIEETEGLFSRHREWFYLLVNIFTSSGYSVRWKVVQCHSYGVPQTRKRLLIVAAGPGETLPEFPPPTYGPPGSFLKPLVTINGAINDIPNTAQDHDQNVRFEGGPRPPFDGNVQAKTITTNAGQGNYHPSGRRPYTLRELASLQTFPMYHSFAGANGVTEKKRQIGNAVPPKLATAMFKSIVDTLKASDAEESAGGQN